MKVPLWLKVGWAVWIAAWVPAYWIGYGPQNFLWFCCIAHIGIGLGLWLESPLVISWQACSVLLIQLIWVVDMLGVLITGVHWIGGTEYMFDASIPLWVRLFSVYHAVHPVILIWAIRRLGYDSRGWLAQSATAAIVLPVCMLFEPQLDINWVRGPFDTPQTVMPPGAYLFVCIAAYVLLLYLPSHLVLSRIFTVRPRHRPDSRGLAAHPPCSPRGR